MSTEKTFQILTESRHAQASDVLIAGLEHPEEATQRLVVLSIANRDCRKGHAALLAKLGVLRNRSKFVPALQATFDESSSCRFYAYIREQLAEGQATVNELAQLSDLAECFQLNDCLEPLISLASTHQDKEFRRHVAARVLSLAQRLGQRARASYRGERVCATTERTRASACSKLRVAAETYQRHQCEDLLDAFLSISNWNDPALKVALSDESPCRSVLMRRLRRSDRPEVMECLAGFLRRRKVNGAALASLLQRNDTVYRQQLLKTISSEPSPTTLNNLKEYGLPDCLRGGPDFVRSVNPRHDAAIAHAYSMAMQQDPETIAVLLTISERHCPPSQGKPCECCESQTLVAIETTLTRLKVPDQAYWLSAVKSSLLDEAPRNDNETIFATEEIGNLDYEDRAALILIGLIRWSQTGNGRLAKLAERLLQNLNVHDMLPVFKSLPEVQRLRLGKILMQTDLETVDTIRDGLRHAVLQHRLDAIDFARALGLLDLLLEPIEIIARTDHQIARIATARALGHAASTATYQLLEELADSPQCSVAEAAKASLQNREVLHS